VKLLSCLLDIVFHYPSAVVLKKSTLQIANVLLDLALQNLVEAVMMVLSGVPPRTPNEILTNILLERISVLISSNCRICANQGVRACQLQIDFEVGLSFGMSNTLLPVGTKDSSLLLHQIVSIIVIHADGWWRRRKEGHKDCR
jgi:hypothetical protein